MPSLTTYPRWVVLQALLRVRERVAHGAPSLESARHYERRLTDRQWVELGKALDAVRFDLPARVLDEAPARQPNEAPWVFEWRELLRAAHRNAHLPWEDADGLSRAQVVTLLTQASEHVRGMPATALGPLFPSPLPIFDRSDS